MNDIEILSKNIRKYRESMKMTQGDLAEILNYSDKTISKWERGESVPDVFVVKKLAEIFRVPMETLLTENKQKETQLNEHILKSLWRNFTLQIIIISILFVFILTYVILNIVTKPRFSYLYLLSIFMFSAISLAVFIYIRCLKHRLDIASLSVSVWLFYIGLSLSLLPAKGYNIFFLLLLPLLSQVFIICYCNFRNNIIKTKIKNKQNKEK